MLHVSVNLMCMQLHRLHKLPTYAHPVLTKAFEMRYPFLKEMFSPYAQPVAIATYKTDFVLTGRARIMYTLLVPL